MATVKGSPQLQMKVVPHRPMRTLVLAILAVLGVSILVISAYMYANYRAYQQGVSPEQAQILRAELAQLRADQTELERQLTQAKMNAEVDRQASEDLRQQLLVRREQIALLERNIAVYRMMSARSSRNPLGINLGKFSIKPMKASAEGFTSHGYHFKLVVQKLAEGDEEFSGRLIAHLVGLQNGEEKKLPLSQIAITNPGSVTLADNIPLSLKYFQNVETDFQVPDGFEPARFELRVESNAKGHPLVLEQQLEWLRP